MWIINSHTHTHIYVSLSPKIHRQWYTRSIWPSRLYTCTVMAIKKASYSIDAHLVICIATLGQGCCLGFIVSVFILFFLFIGRHLYWLILINQGSRRQRGKLVRLNLPLTIDWKLVSLCFTLLILCIFLSFTHSLSPPISLSLSNTHSNSLIL